MFSDMKVAAALMPLLLGSSSAAVFPRQANTTAACEQLAAAFPNQMYAPNTANYTLNAIDNIWSMTCQLAPSCVFTPTTAEDVSKAVGIIHDTQAVFSVVSGGHMPVPGAQTNNGGVVIAMVSMNTLELNDDHSVASIGPGNRWQGVYDWLANYGLAVAGGRYSNVGVGGILLAGGISFFGDHVGWGVNTIVGYQVVLGNGTIIEVSNGSYSDLSWALKGGGNNYGIVTRYDMKTYPTTSAYGGILIWEGEDTLAEMAAAGDNFYLSPEGLASAQTHINPSYTVSRQDNGTMLWQSVLVTLSNGTFDGEPSSLVNFTAIDAPSVGSVQQFDSWVDIPSLVQEYNTADVNGHGQLFGCLASTITTRITQLMIDTILKAAVDELSDVNGLFVAISPEPISTNWLQAAQDAGEYAIDLDPSEGLLVLLMTVTWVDAADDQKTLDFVNSSLTKLKQSLEDAGTYRQFIYMGDAAPGQEPYSTYGKGDGANVDRLNSVQAAYDPLGVFKNLITSGFKL
ncbi:uncharacterized protein F4807DRAFT_442083 [Annulohypoxylon truncatum]|uniref:uncharacterized protein n=1 Tax=Annulohypoxylon truncatum TaxID=327061 RepID=UPI002008349A|nr:uncharacterized protein F4807DRAFT_442083 [Annulohypoxylon truncatum]KAI1205729.1 hypothetical protein F4807DRAFT_442083 [Annulohypoxylon truncatum]